ncbi:hypothetical protein LUZ60_003049 [Juncus effusus]|nr:hypothetical protein LUZ60_003049 [Juncus effusus]
MSSVFSEQVLGDKLSKLNNTQQCIETLSHWCIFHRKDAEKIVQTWDKQFHDSDKERKIPFLYLANDILQNSKKNGKEFVEEFWKVLPAALREMTQHGDERAKTVVSRLVDIWEERRVFGSRPKGLKDLMLGNEPLPKLELNNNKKRARSSVKIVRRDARSIRIKLSIGGTAEKIISAFNAVLDEESEEDSDLERCKFAVKKVANLEKDVENACNNQVADATRRETLSTDLKAEDNSLKKCIEKLKSIEPNRANLVSQLKEALKEQESELEKVRTQVQLAEAAKEQVANLQRRLNNEPIIEPKIKKKKSSAAEVADRLAASAQSTQIMSSVLSSFAQQEKNNNNSNDNNNNNNNNTNNNNNSNISSSGSTNTGVYMIGMPYGYGTAAQPPVVVVPPPAPAAAAPASLGFVRPIMPPQQQNIGLVPINGQMINVNQQFGPPPPGFRMPFYPPPS